MGNQHPSVAPYEPLRCADRELVVAIGNDRQFGMLCDVLGVAELADDARFATNAARVANRDPICAARSRTAWVSGPPTSGPRMLSEARVPAGVVNDIAAAFELARALELGPTVTIERDDGSSVELTRNPIRLSGHAADLPVGAAALSPRGVM